MFWRNKQQRLEREISGFPVIENNSKSRLTSREKAVLTGTSLTTGSAGAGVLGLASRYALGVGVTVIGTTIAIILGIAVGNRIDKHYQRKYQERKDSYQL